MYIKKCFVIFCCLINIAVANAQTEVEVLSDLSFNPVVAQKWKELNAQKNVSFKTAAVTDTISLPFKDDFSQNTVYPNAAWWIDQYVFINRDYPKAPVTIGVATFDGLNEKGLPYDWSVSQSSSDPADTLTSKAIDLGPPLSISDSVYLSFFYQAQGRGNAPEANDSLVLEFNSPTKNWTRVWSKKGYTLQSNDSSFHLVMIPLTDPAYFAKGFRFRFRNYATLSGSLDHWHIDYVYLNKLRTLGDTIFRDVAFVYNAPSLLKNYQAMPWEQYVPSEMKTSIKMFIRNNDTIQKNTSYDYFIKSNSGTVLNTYPGGGANVLPYFPNGYDDNLQHASPPVSFTYPALLDTASFMIENVINTSPDFDPWNDTLRFTQQFYDCFAYDDGTAEAAYGLNQPFSQLAYKFTLNNPDTLKAIKIYFNPVLNNVSQGGASENPFKLTVWGDESGTPSNTPLYQADSVVYAIYDGGYNTFHTYPIAGGSGIKLNSGVFYVGWSQVNANMLNVGFDMNINSQSKVYYNTTGTWATSNYKGSLMIQPVFKKILFAGVRSLNTIKKDYRIYPNPAQDNVYVISNIMDDRTINVSIMNATGKIVLMQKVFSNESIDISGLSNGFYFVRIYDRTENIDLMKKLIITR